jgi:Zn-dependent protease
MDQFIYVLAVNAIPFLLAITMHEAAHGYAAKALGDSTPQRSGRVSLNPLNHFDWLGTGLLPVLSVLAMSVAGPSGFAFVLGWAKPTPINPMNFANPKKDYTLVMLSGVLANVAMGIVWAFVFRASDSSALQAIAFAGMMWNVGLFVLHLIPLPPLAAGMAVAAVLPHHLSERFLALSRYSFFIVLALALTGALAYVLRPAYMMGLGALALIAK